MELDQARVCGREIVDRGTIRAAEGVEAHGFDRTDVHHNIAKVSEQPESLCDCAQLKDLAASAAVEHQLIHASSAFDDVAAVTRVPLEAIVAVAAEQRVITLLAIGEVVARAAGENVGSVATEEHVIAGSAKYAQGTQYPCDVARGAESVVAAAEIDSEDGRRTGRELLLAR